MKNLQNIVNDNKPDIGIFDELSFDDFHGFKERIISFCNAIHYKKMMFNLEDVSFSLEQSHNETNIRIEGEYQGTFGTGGEVLNFLNENIESLIKEYS